MITIHAGCNYNTSANKMCIHFSLGSFLFYWRRLAIVIHLFYCCCRPRRESFSLSHLAQHHRVQPFNDIKSTRPQITHTITLAVALRFYDALLFSRVITCRRTARNLSDALAAWLPQRYSYFLYLIAIQSLLINQLQIHWKFYSMIFV